MAVKRKRKPLLLISIFLIIIVLILIGSMLTWSFLTGPVDKNDDTIIEVDIKSGSSNTQIAKLLEEKKVIKSSDFFKIYVKINNISSLKASSYKLKKSMSLSEIIDILEKGNTYNPDEIRITFNEGKRITDYAKIIEKNTNNSYDDVISTINDKEYVKELINKYWFLTDEILDNQIYYPLEGYLAPDTYYFENKDVSVKTIIEKMLNEMDSKLSKYKSLLEKNIHYYMTMASIVELEGTNTENRKMIVGIFENRLNSKMSLGSDVTTYYGLQAVMTKDLDSEQFASVNGYNTRSSTMIGKMPVGPICNSSMSSIEASLYPTDSDYMYFVADKYGKIYYTKTITEHNSKIKEIKDKGDWIEFED